MITKETAIIEALRMNPQAREIFGRHGMGCIGCMGSSGETIENAARAHNISIDELLAELNKPAE